MRGAEQGTVKAVMKEVVRDDAGQPPDYAIILALSGGASERD